jgi:hypothetical protein
LRFILGRLGSHQAFCRRNLLTNFKKLAKKAMIKNLTQSELILNIILSNIFDSSNYKERNNERVLEEGELNNSSKFILPMKILTILQDLDVSNIKTLQSLVALFAHKVTIINSSSSSLSILPYEKSFISYDEKKVKNLLLTRLKSSKLKNCSSFSRFLYDLEQEFLLNVKADDFSDAPISLIEFIKDDEEISKFLDKNIRSSNTGDLDSNLVKGDQELEKKIIDSVKAGILNLFFSFLYLYSEFLLYYHYNVSETRGA